MAQSGADEGLNVLRTRDDVKTCLVASMTGRRWRSWPSIKDIAGRILAVSAVGGEE